MTAGCEVAVVELDFDRRQETAIPLPDAAAAMASGRFVWIDLDAGDPAEARRMLAGLGLVGEDVVDLALRDEPSTQYGRHDGYCTWSFPAIGRGATTSTCERVSVTLGERFMLTIHRGPVSFLDGVRRDYHGDFVRFAKSPSFLLYEIWDHLIANYLDVQAIMGERVEALQDELRREQVDDDVFARVSAAGRRPAPLPQAAAAGARHADRSEHPPVAGARARSRSAFSATWSAASTTCCRTCWSIATSCPRR